MSSAAEGESYWGPDGGDERCVGYALSSKKAESFITVSLLNHAKQRGIRLVPIDRQKPLSSQGPFHCIIHKLSDADWNRQLTEYSSDHLAVPIIDPPHAIQRLQDRVSMLQVVPRLQIPPSSPSFGIPNQICKTPGDLDDLDLDLLKFPVIAKPLVANGTSKSHQMCLVLRREGLEELEMEAPFVLQEFVNHGGVVFKVYVVGDHVTCVKRRSLPDIIPPYGEGSNSNSNLLSFSQISNASTATDDDDGGGASEMPPLSFLTDFAKALRDALELHLFNFDVIRDSSNHSHYYVIDINYFPGYAKMPSYESVFTDFFLGMLPPHHSSTSPSPSN